MPHHGCERHDVKAAPRVGKRPGSQNDSSYFVKPSAFMRSFPLRRQHVLPRCGRRTCTPAWQRGMPAYPNNRDNFSLQSSHYVFESPKQFLNPAKMAVRLEINSVRPILHRQLVLILCITRCHILPGHLNAALSPACLRCKQTETCLRGVCRCTCIQGTTCDFLKI